MKLCEKMTLLRKENKLSQMELAGILKLSRQAISRWETGDSLR
ncbi:MAG: helix-turn-helix domain-containing protein [Clostridiales bacterium]|nr:helix-turn-helix domain-containing protein [Clostridiales bacterium]MDY4182539.1 helix-turn-helix transcriptional regulator [Pseudoflavonifractor sp.]